MQPTKRSILGLCSIFLFLGMLGIQSAKAAQTALKTYKVMIPGSDYFMPFALTIHAGDSVSWTNNDTDDHTVVSDDAFTTSSSYRGVNKLIKGTDSNGGHPGMFKMKFSHPGTFIYYCRFHAMLNPQKQPVAPGPKGGVQDSNGNYGTPMMGVVVVMPN